jgi:hypothetical protein
MSRRGGASCRMMLVLLAVAAAAAAPAPQRPGSARNGNSSRSSSSSTEGLDPGLGHVLSHLLDASAASCGARLQGFRPQQQKSASASPRPAQHKRLLPLDIGDVATAAAAAVTLLIAAGGGIGGGAVLVPLFILVSGKLRRAPRRPAWACMREACQPQPPHSPPSPHRLQHRACGGAVQCDHPVGGAGILPMQRVAQQGAQLPAAHRLGHYWHHGAYHRTGRPSRQLSEQGGGCWGQGVGVWRWRGWGRSCSAAC